MHIAESKEGNPLVNTGYSPWGHKESDKTERLTHTHTSLTVKMHFYQLSIAQTERGNHNPEKDICSTPTHKSLLLRIKKFYRSVEDRQPNRKHGQRT